MPSDVCVVYPHLKQLTKILILELQVKLDKQLELDAEEQNSLKGEIQSLEEQLKEKDLEIIGRENQLTIQNNKLESEQRKFIIEKDITITQLEVERQNIRVSNHVIPYGILKLLRN